ncbi:Bark storage protein A [Camellia lanceoleosa]|uniref:Bark storage protein A n=1 Tax=Camellia lanceoleosa TaxID=1840588 RepID=A0ACC0J6G4_9ERIC|nr:Bark storage protein A [Camellia lanceoleosa]
MLKIVILVVVVMGFDVKKTIQLKSNHPLHDVVERINEKGGPYIGVVMAYPTEELALLSSGFFLPSSGLPSLQLSGRTFNIGKIKGVDVIYVMTGEQTLNAGITVQILLDVFDIKGIVHYGIAGSANDSLSLGDVSIPKYVAFTGSWNWKEFHSEKGDLPELKFGAYNFPEKGDNLLAKIEFTSQQLYSNGQPMEEVFWLPIEPKWFSLASQLQDMKLVQCVNETYCLRNTTSCLWIESFSSDIFLDNAY